MKYKVHWLIDGVIDIESNKIETAEQTIKDKIEMFIKENADFFDEMGAKAVQGQAYLPGKDE
ncbi:hypothetical protein OAT42_03275 [Alphaproteobacteria bacterium]|jgi:hypothetical protein|nr:hypothetical protein [Alphaproteobacteria bacterium]MDC1133924.1 hypothetical protein [Alphaproteobacteria bacterium]|tara:strand:- start:137 stop:322 length:186 start_codon:yes stop_codon:yes gene_type:complete